MNDSARVSHSTLCFASSGTVRLGITTHVTGVPGITHPIVAGGDFRLSLPDARELRDKLNAAISEVVASGEAIRSECCGETVSRAVPGEGPWTCDNCHGTVEDTWNEGQTESYLCGN